MGAEIADRYRVLEDTRNKMCLLVLPSGKTDLEITDVFIKPHHRYLKVECKLPVQNNERSKLDGSEDSLFFGGFGSRPKKTSYLSRVCHDEKAVVVREIVEIFYLQPVFESPGSNNEQELASGIQLMKIENKDELEHRRKNINYLLKIYNKEEWVKMNYAVQSDNARSNVLKPFTPHEQSRSGEHVPCSVQKLRRIIFNARIVNAAELKKIGCDSIDEVLRDMTTPFRGRFVLKNDFYEKKFQAVRKRVIDRISATGHFPLDDVRSIPENCTFLLEELCDKTREGYFLKGHAEHSDLDDGSFEISDTSTKVLKVVGVHNAVSVDRIVRLTNIDKEEVLNVLLDGPYIRLSNGCYAISEPGSVRSTVLELFGTRESVRKTEIMRTVKDNADGFVVLEDVVQVLETFCQQKGAFWALKRESE